MTTSVIEPASRPDQDPFANVPNADDADARDRAFADITGRDPADLDGSTDFASDARRDDDVDDDFDAIDQDVDHENSEQVREIREDEGRFTLRGIGAALKNRLTGSRLLNNRLTGRFLNRRDERQVNKLQPQLGQAASQFRAAADNYAAKVVLGPNVEYLVVRTHTQDGSIETTPYIRGLEDSKVARPANEDEIERIEAESAKLKSIVADAAQGMLSREEVRSELRNAFDRSDDPEVNKMHAEQLAKLNVMANAVLDSNDALQSRQTRVEQRRGDATVVMDQIVDDVEDEEVDTNPEAKTSLNKADLTSRALMLALADRGYNVGHDVKSQLVGSGDTKALRLTSHVNKQGETVSGRIQTNIPLSETSGLGADTENYVQLLSMSEKDLVAEAVLGERNEQDATAEDTENMAKLEGLMTAARLANRADSQVDDEAYEDILRQIEDLVKDEDVFHTIETLVSEGPIKTDEVANDVVADQEQARRVSFRDRIKLRMTTMMMGRERAATDSEKKSHKLRNVAIAAGLVVVGTIVANRTGIATPTGKLASALDLPFMDQSTGNGKGTVGGVAIPNRAPTSAVDISGAGLPKANAAISEAAANVQPPKSGIGVDALYTDAPSTAGTAVGEAAQVSATVQELNQFTGNLNPDSYTAVWDWATDVYGSDATDRIFDLARYAESKGHTVIPNGSDFYLDGTTHPATVIKTLMQAAKS